jgi:hypothetical protein
VYFVSNYGLLPSSGQRSESKMEEICTNIGRDEVKKDEMGRACSTNEGEEECV